MPIQAYLDESGGKGQGRHMVLAGIVSRSEQWVLFSSAWQDCLDQQPSINYFKMREAAKFAGQFSRWAVSARDEKLRALARIINRYAKFVVYTVIDLDAHAVTWAVSMKKPLNEPYFFPFHDTIMAMCFELSNIGWREQFEIIFDEQVSFGLRARAWYPVMRAVVGNREPEAHALMPVDPMFRSDGEFLPIQAVDLFAWCVRRTSNDPDDREFEWLFKEMSSVILSDYSRYYDKEQMSAVVDKAKAVMNEQLIKEYGEFFGRNR